MGGFSIPSMGGLNLNYPTIDSSIAQFEGFNNPSSLAARNLNPGNLAYGSFAAEYGATLGPSGFATFPTLQSGIAAQDALVTAYANQGYSLTDLINQWSPPTAPGNSAEINQKYIDFVSGKTGLNPLSPIQNQASPSSLSGLLGAGNTLASQLGFGMNPLDNTTPSWWSDVFTSSNLNPLKGVQDLLNTFSWSRVATFFLGLIFIAAGLYMFKPVREVVNTTIQGATITAA